MWFNDRACELSDLLALADIPLMLSRLVLILLSAKNQALCLLEDTNSHAEDFAGMIAESHGVITMLHIGLYFITDLGHDIFCSSTGLVWQHVHVTFVRGK
ncbi:hypothetical protein J2755_001340 [Methanohalophilus levihalophilus]|nr:hypothetical protein [Methanohalophilus levihalophilus]